MSQLLQYFAQKGRSILDNADREGRRINPAEQAEFESWMAKAKAEKERSELREYLERATGVPDNQPVGGTSGGLFRTLKLKAFSLSQKAEGISPETVFGIRTKALGDADEAFILRAPGIIAEGLDRRYVYANLPAQNPGDATSVDVLVSNQRSLAADVDDIDSTQSKQETDSGATLDHRKMQRVATVSDYYPNAIVGLDAFRMLVDTDMRGAISDALDLYVVASLATDAGVDSSIGSGTYEQIRKAMTAIQGNGFSPNLAAISPGDAEALDLERGGTLDTFILPPAPRDSQVSPLWGVKVIVSKSVGDGEPIVLDSSGVEFYLGPLQFAADPLTKFDTNESRFRLEGPTLLAVRQPGAVAGAGGSS